MFELTLEGEIQAVISCTFENVLPILDTNVLPTFVFKHICLSLIFGSEMNVRMRHLKDSVG